MVAGTSLLMEMLASEYKPQAEERQILAVDGNMITLSDPLQVTILNIITTNEISFYCQNSNYATLLTITITITITMTTTTTTPVHPFLRNNTPRGG